MNLVPRSLRGRIALGALVAYLAWQGWLSVAAPGKIAPGFNADAQKVNILVTLSFPPEAVLRLEDQETET